MPETEGIDAFLQEWSGENNLFVPPAKDILKVLNRIQSSKNILGTLVVPYWTSKSYWAVIQEEGKFTKFITDSISIEDASQMLRQGMFRGSFLGSRDYNGGLWALKINSSY